MGKRRINLINTIQLIFFISAMVFSCVFLVIQISSHNKNFKKQSSYIQNQYTNEQKAIIKREVGRVVGLIDTKISSLEDSAQKIVQDKVYMAHDVAENIYLENRETKSKAEITRMIKDALRQIRFENNREYFFVTDSEGFAILNADKPDQENRNILNFQDSDGKYIVQDMIDIGRESGEGLYDYRWSKPGEMGREHRKLSYLKYFEPYGWVIGTGLYVQDVEENIKTNLLSFISTIRFGPEGYIFVNTLDAYALVANGNLLAGEKKLWEVFDTNPQKIKDLFQKEHDAAIQPEGGFIYYSIQKMSDSQTESPKVSYIFGIPQLNWLIGAGVYLDTIDKEIAVYQKISLEELKLDIRNTIIITIFLISVFFIMFFFLSKRLRLDFDLFTEFFDNAVFHDVEIDLNKIRFKEMIAMADKANKMQFEKIKAQNNLKESERHFRLLAESSKDMIFQLRLPGGTYDYISPASLDIFGYTPPEVIDNPSCIRESVHVDWKDFVSEKKQKIITDSSEESFEYMIVNKSGEEKWINQKNKIIKNEQGDVISVIGRLSDETNRKIMEAKLSQGYKLDAIGQLAGGVAHDFNNVLAGIISAAQVLKSPKREIDEKGQKMVELIMNAALLAADLTAKLSTFSRKKTLMLKPQNLHLLINETSVILKRTLDKKITLNIENNAENCISICEGAEIQSSILNLVINASHVMPDGGTIDIITKNRFLSKSYCDSVPFDVTEGLYIEIAVRDRGCGINQENLKRIFEPFFSTKASGKGTGLGLATVYTTMVDHQGLVDVNSEIGQGSTFFLVLPCTEEILEEKKSINNSLQGTGHILFVDDEEIIRSTGKSMLEDLGFTVLIAENGLEAVELFETKHEEIDLVIMDVIMPKMNGVEAFSKMKEINPDCSIIMISGQSDREDVDNLKQMGLRGFLKKPFSDEDLMKIIKEIIKETA